MAWSFALRIYVPLQNSTNQISDDMRVKEYHSKVYFDQMLFEDEYFSHKDIHYKDQI